LPAMGIPICSIAAIIPEAFTANEGRKLRYLSPLAGRGRERSERVRGYKSYR
jgi:hypothetical protein